MINARLYSALQQRFGRGKVRVIREDVPFDGRHVRRDGEIRLKRNFSGEEYQLKCPRCRDHKPRLSISHLWGQYDRKTETRNLWLIQCWNEGCYSEYPARRELFDELFGNDLGWAGAKDDRPQFDERGQKVAGRPMMPGKLFRLDQLFAKVPSHPAVLYAQKRLWSPAYLGDRWGVGYCSDPWLSQASNRLIAPVFMGGKLKGWTGRYMGDHKEDEVAKWYHDPNMKKSELWYNLDVARQHHTKFLVEGPGDVWGVGDPGLGCLGKTLSPTQIKLLQDCCSDDFALVVMLDPVQDAKAKAKGQPHHIEATYRQLTEVSRFRDKVLKVYLPPHLDPGEADRGFVFGYTRYLANQAGVRIVLPEAA